LLKFRISDDVRFLQVLTGVFCLVLAVVVLLGWITGTNTLIQIYPDFAPMMPNTAVCFLLSGLLFICHAYHLKRTGPVLSAFIFLIGALSFSQYVFSWDLGIDELLLPYNVSYLTHYPGRMAPTTAVSFCLIALGFFSVRFFQKKYRFVVSGSMGAILIGLGGISFAGYINGSNSIYIWGMFTTMAMHTSFAFLVIGIMLIYEAWKRGSQITPVILVVCVGLMLSVQVFHVLRYQQGQNFEMEFISKAEDRVSVFRRYLESDIQMMDALKAFFDSSNEVDMEEFSLFVKNAVESNKTLYAVDWVPRVTLPERDAFVLNASRLYAPRTFEIRERNEFDEVVVSPPRDEHYPVLYSEPLHIQSTRAGFDLAADSERMEAMKKAAETGRAVSILQSKRLDHPGEIFNMVMMNPVYKKNEVLKERDPSFANLQGFVVGNFHFCRIFEEIFLKIGLQGIDMMVYDATNPDEEKFLYYYDPSAPQRGASILSLEKPKVVSAFSYEEAIPVGDKTLKFYCAPSVYYVKPLSNALPWAASLAVALFVLLIAQYLALVVSRDRVIMQTVQERTDELSKVNLILRDEVAQRRLAEEELRQSRSFFKTIIDNLPVAVFAKNAKPEKFGTFELWNKRAETMFGLSKDKVIGKTDYDQFPREQADFFLEKDRQVFRDDRLVDIPSEPVDTPYGRRFLHTIKVPVWDELHQPRHLLGISEDITDRIKTESALRQSEEHFREAFASSAIGMALLSIQGRWVRVNPALCKILRYSEAELLATDFQRLTHPEDLEKDLEYVRKMIAGEIRSYQMEKRYIRKGGEAIWCLLSVGLVRDEQGQPVTFVSQVQDIHDQKEAEQEIRRKSVELARSNKELEEFAYVASHDLQEPLRKIISFSKLLEEKEGGKLDEESQDYLQRVVSGAGRMRHLIEDLLTYSRVMRKQQPFTPVDLNELVKNVLLDLELRILETEASIKIENLPRLMADPTQIHQIFLNLIGNAIKFRKKDSVPVIEISSTDLKNGFHEIRIKDNGIGFDEKYLDRIFVPFQRLHTRTEYEGTGIGLSVCQKIVNRHGGTITAKSRPGEGAVFIVTLPAAV